VSVSYEDVVRWVRSFADIIAQNKEYLTQLDSGDRDADTRHQPEAAACRPCSASSTGIPIRDIAPC